MTSETEFTREESEAIARQRTLPRLLAVPATAVGVVALDQMWPSSHPLVIAAWTVFTAYMMFCWTSCFHEAAHQTLWPSKRLSIWQGRAFGTLMFTPYTVYRENHIRHHAYLNRPTDWELWPYSDPGKSLAFRRVFVWFDLVFGLFTGPFIYGRIFFHKDSPIKNPKLRRTIWLEYLGIVLFWGASWTAVTWLGAWDYHLRAVITPLFLAAMMQSGRKLTEHLGMASYDPILGTRTVMPGNWLIKLCSFLNFDIFIHGPHHRHPRASHTTLAVKMREYVSANPDVRYPVFPSYWRATRAMLPSMWRNPGCGMNAGAQPPGKARRDDVDNFYSDVVQEVLEEDTPSPAAT